MSASSVRGVSESVPHAGAQTTRRERRDKRADSESGSGRRRAAAQITRAHRASEPRRGSAAAT